MKIEPIGEIEKEFYKHTKIYKHINDRISTNVYTEEHLSISIVHLINSIVEKIIEDNGLDKDFNKIKKSVGIYV